MTTALSKFTKAELANPSNLDAQFALLREFGLPETAAERYYVELRGETKVLCKRDEPISIYEDLDGHARSVSAGQRTGADRARFNAARGRYNDAQRLTDGQYYGDIRPVGDVAAWNA